MKYPQAQLTKVQDAIDKLKPHIDLSDLSPTVLHYLVYQQYSPHQSHNKIFVRGGVVLRRHQISDDKLNEFKQIIDDDESFELYPDGCDDSHIETAMKRIKI